jgi:iron complex transport system substrate-binding protein
VRQSDSPDRKAWGGIAVLLAATALAATIAHRFAPAAGAVLPLRDRDPAAFRIETGALAYPREARDAGGFLVTVPRPVRRVVSQYWSIDEFLYSIVPPAHIRGVSESAHREAVSNVFPLVQRYRPVVASDPERVLRLNPDLILVSSSARADFTALVRSAGVPVFRMHTDFTSLAQLAETIRLVGYLTGEDSAAAAEHARFIAAIERARRRRPASMPPPRVLGFGGQYSYGTGTVFHDVVETLGARNVAADGGLRGYAGVNGEQILRWNPEWIFTGANEGQAPQTLARLRNDPAIALTAAAQSGRIVVLDNRVFLPMSPFTARLLEAIGDALYGK